MLCKWCGKQITHDMRKCPVCKQSVMLANASGGFSCQRPAIQLLSKTDSLVESPVTAPPSTAMSIPWKRRNTRKLLLSAVLILALVLTTTGGYFAFKQRNAQPFATKAVSVELFLKDSQIVANSHFGKQQDRISPYCTLEHDGVFCVVTMDNTKEILKIHTAHTGNREEGTLMVNCTADDEIFGDIHQVEYRWEYRDGITDDWGSLPDFVTSQIDNDEGSSLEYKFLKNEDVSENGQFRCIITRKTSKGGELSVTMEGVTLPYKNPLETES